uniref:Carrier domain-containing protein n=1 Tax=Leptocylindrus danicus TaxID=163516 RepID=A0A7S2KTU2_9STRA|eukprot:CAMPEP_0116009596 /NCGR_PEP_ID=MMETSP0321-20121206/3521_1 /TAXON_ID=163516 /ORGANISM="Leptocylindrus danicus var. danicus, Strain B650" /LENGTH=193 /DNA_ID=CAMNT_0003478577 /DNA_START=118 /DNA_END=699 /DNA_ORIENTATION=+
MYEWYWMATRHGEYWAMPRDFYWFSPKYCPIDIWEFFILLFLTVALSVILEFHLNSVLVEWSALLVQKLTGKDSLVIGKEATVTEVLIQIIGSITGGSDVDASSSLLESGLSSITSLVLIAKIKQHYKSLVLTSRDIFEVETVGEFSALIADRLNQTAKNGGGFEFNTTTRIARKSRRASVALKMSESQSIRT